MMVNSPAADSVIDADAHVVESAHMWTTWTRTRDSTVHPSRETREDAGVKLQFWVIDDKVRGFRFPVFSAAELERRSRQVGRGFADQQESLRISQW
jgi:hypothetical protein